ncbi:MAG: hypothetical protein HY360_23875 [Verrucomicrobia bacterium]|nr:hypothetical protein [Verrucomicrobiota bacterium]
MNPILEKLLILQDRDTRLARLALEQSRLPVEEAALDDQAKNAAAAVEQARASCRRFETDRKKLEVEAAGKEDLVRKYKTQLLEVKNNDQFHALQHEITASEDEIRKIEDVELDLMEKLEQAQKEIKATETSLQDVTRQQQSQRDELKRKVALIEKQTQELHAERVRLASEIEEDVLSRYERIFRSKHGQAIVGISRGMCMGCHLKLTAQEIHNAQRDNEMVACTNCGRVLYWTGE